MEKQIREYPMADARQGGARARRGRAAVGALALLAACGTTVVWQQYGARFASRSARPPAGAVYAPSGQAGYGGYARGDGAAGKPARPAVAPPPTSARAQTSAARLTPDPLAGARAAYARGDYRAVEAAAERAIRAAAPRMTVAAAPAAVKTEARKTVARGQHLLGFAAAREKDFAAARDRFAAARRAADGLPEDRTGGTAKTGTVPALGTPPSPTLEEDAAYQHAVCAMAMGDRAGAEREFVAFVRDYPESPLVHAAMRRVARLHGGDIPKDAEGAWRGARAVQATRRKERDRLASLCGPECLAELLRRQGKAADVETLARRMKTGERGTSLAALRDAARATGFPAARGVALTADGLRRQKLPLIALVAPGHFVLVEKVAADGSVTVWDPAPKRPAVGEKDGSGATDASVTREYAADEWARAWPNGIALTLGEGAPAVTAERPSREAANQTARAAG